MTDLEVTFWEEGALERRCLVIELEVAVRG